MFAQTDQILGCHEDISSKYLNTITIVYSEGTAVTLKTGLIRVAQADLSLGSLLGTVIVMTVTTLFVLCTLLGIRGTTAIYHHLVPIQHSL